jgi:endoribonuclease Dicer
MNYENLEILGDCFLKLAVSMSLYIHYPSASAGELTCKKKHQISNENLYRLAVQNNLKEYLYALGVGRGHPVRRPGRLG